MATTNPLGPTNSSMPLVPSRGRDTFVSLAFDDSAGSIIIDDLFPDNADQGCSPFKAVLSAARVTPIVDLEATRDAKGHHNVMTILKCSQCGMVITSGRETPTGNHAYLTMDGRVCRFYVPAGLSDVYHVQGGKYMIHTREMNHCGGVAG